jgi:MFS family permease
VRLLRSHEQLLVISGSTVLVMAGQGVIGPVLPLFARELGVGTASIGLTLSAFALARLVLNVPLGLAADRWGRKALLVAGPAVTMVGMVGSGLSVGFLDLLAWRFVAGAGSAMYMTGAQLFLIDISTPETRARFIATNQGALLFGTAIGPGIGGLVAEWYGLRAPFHVVGVAALSATVYAWRRLPETRHLAEAQVAAAAAEAAATADAAPADAPADPDRRPRAAWRRVLRSPDFLAVSLVTTAIFFTRTAGRQTLLPLLGDERLGLSPGQLGGLFTAMALVNLALIAPSAMAADRFGRKWTIVPSGVAVACSLVLLAAAPGAIAFVGASLLLAVGTGIVGPAPAAYAADVVPAESRGAGMGLYRSAGDIGFLVGPPLLGAIADATSLGWGLVANAALMAGAAGVFAVVARETVRRDDPEPAPTAP